MMSTVTAATRAWREAGAGPEIVPHHERRDGNRENGRNEHGGDSVRQPLNRSLGSLRLLHESDDSREHRVATHAIYPDPERSVPVECRPHDGGAWGLGDW